MAVVRRVSSLENATYRPIRLQLLLPFGRSWDFDVSQKRCLQLPRIWAQKGVPGCRQQVNVCVYTSV